MTIVWDNEATQTKKSNHISCWPVRKEHIIIRLQKEQGLLSSIADGCNTSSELLSKTAGTAPPAVALHTTTRILGMSNFFARQRSHRRQLSFCTIYIYILYIHILMISNRMNEDNLIKPIPAWPYRKAQVGCGHHHQTIGGKPIASAATPAGALHRQRREEQPDAAGITFQSVRATRCMHIKHEQWLMQSPSRLPTDCYNKCCYQRHHTCMLAVFSQTSIHASMSSNWIASACTDIPELCWLHSPSTFLFTSESFSSHQLKAAIMNPQRDMYGHSDHTNNKIYPSVRFLPVNSTKRSNCSATVCAATALKRACCRCSCKHAAPVSQCLEASNSVKQKAAVKWWRQAVHWDSSSHSDKQCVDTLFLSITRAKQSILFSAIDTSFLLLLSSTRSQHLCLQRRPRTTGSPRRTLSPQLPAHASVLSCPRK